MEINRQWKYDKKINWKNNSQWNNLLRKMVHSVDFGFIEINQNRWVILRIKIEIIIVFYSILNFNTKKVIIKNIHIYKKQIHYSYIRTVDKFPELKVKVIEELTAGRRSSWRWWSQSLWFFVDFWWSSELSQNSSKESQTEYLYTIE